jgi:hypothetical protein
MSGGTGTVDRTTRLIPELHGHELSSGAGPVAVVLLRSKQPSGLAPVQNRRSALGAQ